MADRFAHAYLQRDSRARAFIPHRYDVADDRAKAVTRAAKRSVSAEVQASLRTLNQRLAPSAARSANLDALSQPGTVCVVTGQQVGLFLGPLYTIYKAAAAIVTARTLQAETGCRTVPVFWLQTEDHDFAEVATTYVPRTNNTPLALTASGDAESRVSMAHRTFDADIAALLDQLRTTLGTLPSADDAVAQLGRHYRPGAGWVDAFTGLMAELFAADGLIFFDPRAHDAALLTTAVHCRAIEQAEAIAAGLQKQSQALVDAGFSAPVHVRPGAPLCFFHPDGAEGPRYRILPHEGRWTVLGRRSDNAAGNPSAQASIEAGGGRATDATRVGASVYAARDADPLHTRTNADGSIEHEALMAALGRDARCFSTSALLRPVLQDSLLPTAAYVGGPGEIDYFAQLAPVYDAFELPMPLLVPRARFAVVEAKTRKGLDELCLAVEALAQPEDALLNTVACRPEHLPEPEALHESLIAAMKAELTRLSPEFESLQPGLRKAAEKTVDAADRSCGKFVDKYRVALNQADTRRVETVRRLKAALFPLDAPQERILSLPYFAARYGTSAFVARVVERCRPFHPALEALEL